MNQEIIRMIGAKQHNLKNLDIEIPVGQVTVITGVSGSGKSSLAFNTLYAEGQRRYVESFSTYARQFMDRMQKPDVDEVEGILPAIAINQSDRVRSSRSTVGTMTGITDYIKLFFANHGQLFCGGCERPIEIENPEFILNWLMQKYTNQELSIAFPIRLPSKMNPNEILESFQRQGFHKGLSSEGAYPLTVENLKEVNEVYVYVDKTVANADDVERLMDSLEQAYRFGKGRLGIVVSGEKMILFSEYYHCPDCNLHYPQLNSNLFSFNSPLGACGVCNGYGRILDLDLEKIIPNPNKSIADGCVRTWQTQGYSNVQHDLMEFAEECDVDTHKPFHALSEKEKKWLIEGEGDWYGIRGFFDWLKSKSYKMHIRVLLSKYRSAVLCSSCQGARLKPQALQVKINFRNIAEVYALNIAEVLRYFKAIRIDGSRDKVARLILDEINARLKYLLDVGLAYLTLDRQSRTLSGGEMERVNLTTAIGTNLVNTLFILDEPSIGLHPRDNERLIGLIHRLKENRNTVVLVEHDPEIIQSSDYCIDLGPGAGEEGGEIIYKGPVHGLIHDENSLTGKYLSRKRQIPIPRFRRSLNKDYAILVRGAKEHNLKNINVYFPLGGLICVTGVSGSGKSTLVEDILYRAIIRLKGFSGEVPGEHQEIEGCDKITDCILVTQDPIGKTPRANPATYLKVYTSIREIFSETPLAQVRRYGPQYFSFNLAGGRCDLCQGEGFEKIEMQFLSDVYVPCTECQGKRFRKEILEVEYKDKNISEVLDMTIRECMDFFSDVHKIVEPLKVLVTIGLDYLKLGQPMNTLSGGESQRLKLAYFMSVVKRNKTLFIFDEPTTGLHIDDVKRLLFALDELIENGNSCIVVEHHLDVIKSADHVIDLGPEGGDEGGQIVFEGTPEELICSEESITGKYLKTVFDRIPLKDYSRTQKLFSPTDNSISVVGAKEHNLKNVSLQIPRDQFVVITGLSGSGKSTLAFDILFSEGQRRYIESLSAYARQFMNQLSRPNVDFIDGIPPTISIEQRMSHGGWRSTVATETEIYQYLRLLFSKLGLQFCYQCNQRISSQTLGEIYNTIVEGYQGKFVSFFAPVIRQRKGVYKEIFERLQKKDVHKVRIDGRLRNIEPCPILHRYKEHSIDALVTQIKIDKSQKRLLKDWIQDALLLGKGSFYLSDKGSQDVLFSLKLYCPNCVLSYEELDPRMFSYNSKHGYCEKCNGYGFININEEEESASSTCPDCKGQRLKRSVLGVKVHGKSIGQLCRFPVAKALSYFRRLKFEGREKKIGEGLIKEIIERLDFLVSVGLSYLSLERSVRTLSGGELQRIRLASQLGSRLKGICYILDEPTIGLHARDNQKLLQTLKQLKHRGNSVIVVEHDEETIRSADTIIDLGPKAGQLGGTVVAQGSVKEISENHESITGRYLSGKLESLKAPRRKAKSMLKVMGAKEHNLKNIDVEIPLGLLVCVTGVSGSGKSTLTRDVLYNGLRKMKYEKEISVGCFDKISGHEHIERVIEVDQTPIGKTPRSIPASYVGLWSEIRNLYAMMPEAKMRGYSASRFSFNVRGGRCEKCKGQGRIRVEMSFLPQVNIICDDCIGLRFNEETRQVLFKGYSIAQVLEMTVEEAEKIFVNFPKIKKPLQLLKEIGLGYIQLGQASNTLSGGEAQRIKLVYELSKESRGKTIYFLDEPTTGLHYEDIRFLMNILQRLVDRGNTVILIEHNLDVIHASDYLIDLGPEGGDEGGHIVAVGTPEEIAEKDKTSYTGKYLKEKMKSFENIELTLVS